jgi:predicted ferric reductase
MRPFGLILIFICLTVPFAFLPQLAAQHDAGAFFSQLVGSSAIVGMALAQLLATRWHGLEMIFGGLDRMYVEHKWLGIGSMAAILLHDTVDADVRGLGRETLLNGLGETMGEISLYGLLGLVVITILTFVPYKLWRFTHKLMGAFFTLGALHFALVLKPFANTDPLGLYVLGFALAGVIAWFYTIAPFGWFQARQGYRVNETSSQGAALSVVLEPEGKGIRHNAGQFAFFGFGQGFVGETHPFTLSQGPKPDRQLRITFSALGDHTNQLTRQLQTGDTVQVSRGFGHFLRPRPDKPQIWIAGGIGITPFLAWADTLSESDAPVHLFCCVRSSAELAHAEALKARFAALANATLHVIESKNEGRLTAEKIVNRSGLDLNLCTVAFCGPEPMREALRKGLTALGLPRRQFMYEEFEIRSGIGIRRMVGWLVQRFLAQKTSLERPSPPSSA